MAITIKEIAAGRIRALRKQAGLGQKEVADALKVGVNTVSLWERGETWPEAGKFDEMAKLFGVPVSEFFNASAPSLDASLGLILEELGYDASALKKKKKAARD